MQVSMTINGESYSHDIEPRLLLVHYIREYAELHGTHWGCDTSNCGICIVLMDDQPIKSCTTLAALAEGQTSSPSRAWAMHGSLRRSRWRSTRCTRCSAASAPRA